MIIIFCTLDYCSNTASSTDGCVHEPIICQNTTCTTSICNPSIGCVSSPYTCPNSNQNFCASSTCDETAGCINVEKVCLFSEEISNPSQWNDPYPLYWKYTGPTQYKSEDCFSSECDFATQKCVVSMRTPFTPTCESLYTSPSGTTHSTASSSSSSSASSSGNSSHTTSTTAKLSSGMKLTPYSFVFVLIFALWWIIF